MPGYLLYSPITNYFTHQLGHNVWHAEAGLVMSFYTRPDVVEKWQLPSDLTGFCSHPNATNGMLDDIKEVVPPEWRHE